MGRFNIERQRLVALALLGLVLFNPPLLHVQAGDGGAGAGLYLFGAWAILIAMAAWVSEASRG